MNTKLPENENKIAVVKSEITVPADYLSIRDAGGELRALLSKVNASDDLIGMCELVLQELLTNLVEHAYLCDASGRIKIQMWVDKMLLVIETMDTGEAYPQALQKMGMPNPADLQVGGYGMALIQSLMDKVSYQRLENQNIWRLEKKI